MSDIVVTTPRGESANSAAEAACCIAAGGGNYFRTLSRAPRDLSVGDRVFYVEDGYVRGYARVSKIGGAGGMTCQTTGRRWVGGCVVVMPADSWRWIKPLRMRGFQGWRYWSAAVDAVGGFCEIGRVEEVGGWLDSKPEVPR